MESASKLLLWDHPTSSYAQKVRIALREKGIEFDSRAPKGLGSGAPVPDLEPANPRLEVPALEDGGFKYVDLSLSSRTIRPSVHVLAAVSRSSRSPIPHTSLHSMMFDSTVILGYIEDKYPEHPLLPKDPIGRANARMIEEVCDTVYEATNWTYSEIAWSGRAEGELADNIIAKIKQQTAVLQSWLAEKLGDKVYFNGDSFGYADICVGPLLNRSVYYGFGPADGTALQRWHVRIKTRPSVEPTFAEMVEGAKAMSTSMRKFIDGGAKREYRDHRLEAMVKLGGIDVVLEGLKRDNIRFGWPTAAQ